MAIPLSINGQVFEYPDQFDEGWGVNATGWAQAVTNGMLQRAGGNFPLLAEVDFGASFGLKATYYKTRSASPATAGVIQLAATDSIDFSTSNYALSTDGSGNLTWRGSKIAGSTGAVSSITGTIHQIVASASVGDITLSTPQDIDTNSSPTFANTTLSSSLILQDTELTPKTVTVSAPTTLSTNWNFKYPINAGSNGQVLSTDGSGNTLWINAAGGGTVNSGTAGQLTYYATSSTTVSGNPNLLYVEVGGVTSLNITDTSGSELLFTKSGGQVEFILGASNIFDIKDVTNARDLIKYDPTPNTITTTGSWSFSSAVSMGSNKINNVTDPTSAQDAATKNYVDTAIANLANYVESTRSDSTSANFGGSGSLIDVLSIALPVGTWRIEGLIQTQLLTVSMSQMAIAISPNAGNTSSGLVSGQNRMITFFNSPSTLFSFYPLYASTVVVVSSPSTYYLKLSGIYSGGPPTYTGARITATLL